MWVKSWSKLSTCIAHFVGSFVENFVGNPTSDCLFSAV
jgi:hypothetical protein